MGSEMTPNGRQDAIDFVYTWVDGEKNATLREHYAQVVAKENPGSIPQAGSQHSIHVSGHNRFRDNQEIVQSIASVRRFAPFVRKIFIVAAEGQIPDWYTKAAYPEVEMVFHPEIFGDQFGYMLPTFNSHTIEAMLPFIPGLSERFVYFNDDMFLGAAVTPEDFFDPDGTAVVRVHGQVADFWQGHKKTWRVYRGNMHAALQKYHPGMTVYDTAHQGRTLLKSVCLDTWNTPHWKALLVDTAECRFRDLSNMPPIELFSNLMLLKGAATVRKDAGYVLQLFDGSVLGPEFAALKNLQPKFYCINDDMHAPTERHLERVRQYLGEHLPHHLNPEGVSELRICPPRPRLGRVLQEIAHTISWCNRMLGKLVGLFRQRNEFGN